VTCNERKPTPVWVEATRDGRSGQAYLGTEYANKRVTVAVVEVMSDRPDDDELAATYRKASESAAALTEEWSETSDEGWDIRDK